MINGIKQARLELETQKTTSQEKETQLSEQLKNVQAELEQIKLKRQSFQGMQVMPTTRNFSFLDGIKNEQDKHEETKKLLAAEQEKVAALEKQIKDLKEQAKSVNSSFSEVGDGIFY